MPGRHSRNAAARFAEQVPGVREFGKAGVLVTCRAPQAADPRCRGDTEVTGVTAGVTEVTGSTAG